MDLKQLYCVRGCLKSNVIDIIEYENRNLKTKMSLTLEKESVIVVVDAN